MKTVGMLSNDKFIIHFTYDPATVAQVRCLPPGRRWDPVSRCWTCPASVDALTKLKEYGFEILPAVQKWEEGFYSPKKPSFHPISEITNLKGNLYPFQADGVGFISAHGGRVLLADEMGLGKTVQALAWLQHYPLALPAAIVCPASLKGNWETECENWTTIRPSILLGTRAGPLSHIDWLYILNYDILHHWLPFLGGIKTVILDECHFVKNPKAKRTKAVQLLCRNKPHVIALSGTPIVNRPIEFFTALHILAPTTFKGFWDYAQRYCAPKHNGFGWDFTGASYTDELHQRINNVVMLRRTKTEVLKDLPEKTRSTIAIDLNENRGGYVTALRDALGEWGKNSDKPDPLRDITQISHLRQAAVDSKFDLCKEWIENFLETGRKLVVFTIHHKTSDRLMSAFGNIHSICLDGRTDVRLRSGVVEKFQNDPTINMLIGNIQVAGTGFTMTAAQDAAFMELPWTPGEVEQAEDRIHRIGQKGAVNIYYLIAKGTLEEDILALINEKRKVVKSVLDGESMESTSILSELVKRLKKRKEINEK